MPLRLLLDIYAEYEEQDEYITDYKGKKNGS
jgi:hypothetical protein